MPDKTSRGGRKLSPRKKSRMIQTRKLQKRILGLLVLTIFAVSLFGYYSLYFEPGMNQSKLDPGYRYWHMGPVAVNSLEELGVKSNQSAFSNWKKTGFGYNSTEIDWEGSFLSNNATIYYALRHYDDWRTTLEHQYFYSNGNLVNKTYVLAQHYVYYFLVVAFYASTESYACNLSLPSSDVNCSGILFFDFENTTSSQTHRYTLTMSDGPWLGNATVHFFDSDPSHYLLNSKLSFTVGIFQGYSWCPVYRVDNMSRLLCQFNPDYGYREIASMNVSSLPSTGRVEWQNVALNYTLADGLLQVTVDSAPSCDVEKPITSVNCQGILLVGFEIANPPPYSGAPSDIAYVLQVGKTEKFHLYPTNSGVHQQLYLLFGSYVGNYKGLLWPYYASGTGYSTYP